MIKIKMKIKKGDTVKMLSGKDKSKTGKVTHVFPVEQKIVIEGINIRKKRMKPKREGQSGQTIQMPLPVHVSTAMIVCSSCGRATRVEKKDVAGKMIRVCKKCKGELV